MPYGLLECAEHPKSRSCCPGSGRVLGPSPVGGVIQRSRLSHTQPYKSKHRSLILPKEGLILKTKSPSGLLSSLLKVTGRGCLCCQELLQEPWGQIQVGWVRSECGVEAEQTSWSARDRPACQTGYSTVFTDLQNIPQLLESVAHKLYLSFTLSMHKIFPWPQATYLTWSLVLASFGTPKGSWTSASCPLLLWPQLAQD